MVSYSFDFPFLTHSVTCVAVCDGLAFAAGESRLSCIHLSSLTALHTTEICEEIDGEFCSICVGHTLNGWAGFIGTTNAQLFPFACSEADLSDLHLHEPVRLASSTEDSVDCTDSVVSLSLGLARSGGTISPRLVTCATQHAVVIYKFSCEGTDLKLSLLGYRIYSGCIAAHIVQVKTLSSLLSCFNKNNDSQQSSALRSPLREIILVVFSDGSVQFIVGEHCGAQGTARGQLRVMSRQEISQQISTFSVDSGNSYLINGLAGSANSYEDLFPIDDCIDCEYISVAETLRIPAIEVDLKAFAAMSPTTASPTIPSVELGRKIGLGVDDWERSSSASSSRRSFLNIAARLRHIREISDPVISSDLTEASLSHTPAYATHTAARSFADNNCSAPSSISATPASALGDHSPQPCKRMTCFSQREGFDEDVTFCVTVTGCDVIFNPEDFTLEVLLVGVYGDDVGCTALGPQQGRGFLAWCSILQSMELQPGSAGFLALNRSCACGTVTQIPNATKSFKTSTVLCAVGREILILDKIKRIVLPLLTCNLDVQSIVPITTPADSPAAVILTVGNVFVVSFV